MDAFIKARTNLLYTHWRDRTASLLILISLLWVAATIVLASTLSHPGTSGQPVTSKTYTSEKVTRQQLANRYRDPSLSYFFDQ
ncbi:MAG: hypothetical protein ACFB16_17020 [Phormidesmis sp.]